MYQPLPEIRIYFAAHILFVVYSIYSLYLFRYEIFKDNSDYGFESGWKILPSSQRDASDFEWTSWKRYILGSFPFYLIYFAFSVLIKYFDLNGIRQYILLGVSLAFLTSRFGIIIFLGIVLFNLLFYFLAFFKIKFVIWIAAGIPLLCINLMKTETIASLCLNALNLSEENLFEIIIILAWSLLKSISYALEYISHTSEGNRFNFINYCCYVFYFPTLYLGPHINYTRFNVSSRISISKREFWNSFKGFFTNIFICICWSVILEIALHFLFINNVQNSLNIFHKVDSICLFGFGYLMGQYFHLKYVIGYGIGIAFARWDDHNPPKKPMCIARIHRYSDMWKYFDEGLYEFLFKYIYCLITPKNGSTLKKTLAMSMTFLFVYFWHGYFLFVLIWTLMNFICLVFENHWTKLKANPEYQTWIASYLSKSNQHRLEAVIGTQILILAVISNFFFLANEEIGYIFMKRTYLSGILHYILLSLCLVFIYFTSEHINLTKKRKTEKYN